MYTHIGKAASNTANFIRPTLFYGSAREGFTDALRALLPADRKAVLLPAFIGQSPREGSGVFDPIREVNAQPFFYPLNLDLTVNISWLEEALANYRPAVMVLIHYFGHTDPNVARVAELARKYGALLVEDLAHGFFSAFEGLEAGRHGDLCLFSLHKMFPMQVGGMVRYKSAELITDQSGTSPDLAAGILGFDWSAISTQRRANFASINFELKQSKMFENEFELLRPGLIGRDVPQTLPVRIRDADRDHVYHAMNADGFGMTSLYHTMIDEIREDFPEMTGVSRSIINFPVHQDMIPGQAEAIVRSFESALKAAGHATRRSCR